MVKICMRYEVLSQGDRFVVNLRMRIYNYRVWQLNGIPCKHVYRVMVCKKDSIKDYVDECYHKIIFFASYQYAIRPVEGEKFWHKTFN